jgi:hypothetical protein
MSLLVGRAQEYLGRCAASPRPRPPGPLDPPRPLPDVGRRRSGGRRSASSSRPRPAAPSRVHVRRRTSCARRRRHARRGDVRGHACYPLVPYSNRIANARLAVSGRVLELARNFGEHPHAIHGVGWQRPWRVLAHNATSALLALEHTAAGVGARAWPWPFRATQSFALCADRGGATLTVKLALANAGDAPFPFGLGFHPYFPRTPTTALEFEAQSYWETDTTQLPVGRIALPAAWRQGLLDARRGETIDNVFTNWKGAATLSDPAWPSISRSPLIPPPDFSSCMRLRIAASSPSSP